MILADKIIEERKRSGWSQEELAEKLNVSRQSVSKWEVAQSVPDLNRILQMAELFGVTTDYLLKDEMSISDFQPAEESGSVRENVVKVSMEDASEFIRIQRKNAPKIAFGVALCIASPIILLVLLGLAESGMFSITESFAPGFGVSILLLMVAFGVYLFIRCGIDSKKYEFLDTAVIETEYGVSGMAREKRQAYMDSYNRAVSTGVVLCIVSCVPLLLSMVFTEKAYIITLMVGFLLLVVSAAVYLFVSRGIVKASFDRLLEEGDYTGEKKKIAPVLGEISGIYWMLATAVFLAWSFASDRWDFTWIVWPVAGVLFPAVMACAKMLIKKKD